MNNKNLPAVECLNSGRSAFCHGLREVFNNRSSYIRSAIIMLFFIIAASTVHCEEIPWSGKKFFHISEEQPVTSLLKDIFLSEGVVLHPELETLLHESLRQTPHGIYISAPGHVLQTIINRVNVEIKRVPMQRLAILTTSEIRHHIRKAVERFLPDVPVLAHSELTPEVKIIPLANINAKA